MRPELVHPRGEAAPGRAFIEAVQAVSSSAGGWTFPFLFGGAFIEVSSTLPRVPSSARFPYSFLAFIEAAARDVIGRVVGEFPFLLGRAFIEAANAPRTLVGN